MRKGVKLRPEHHQFQEDRFAQRSHLQIVVDWRIVAKYYLRRLYDSTRFYDCRFAIDSVAFCSTFSKSGYYNLAICYTMNLSAQQKSELVLGLLFIIYLVLGLRTPDQLANLVDTVPGKLGLAVFVGLMFWKNHPILAILGLLVAFNLIYRSSSGLDALQRYAPSEVKKASQFTAFNQFPYTLEQEMVKKMAPAVNAGTSTTRPGFKPSSDELHGAQNL